MSFICLKPYDDRAISDHDIFVVTKNFLAGNRNFFGAEPKKIQLQNQWWKLNHGPSNNQILSRGE